MCTRTGRRSIDLWMKSWARAANMMKSGKRYDKSTVQFTQAAHDGAPPPPEAAYFDRDRGALVISRYAEVMAAFRKPLLWPLAPQRADDSNARDEAGRLRLRPDVQEALSAARVAEWRG